MPSDSDRENQAALRERANMMKYCTLPSKKWTHMNFTISITIGNAWSDFFSILLIEYFVCLRFFDKKGYKPYKPSLVLINLEPAENWPKTARTATAAVWFWNCFGTQVTVNGTTTTKTMAMRAKNGRVEMEDILIDHSFTAHSGECIVSIDGFSMDPLHSLRLEVRMGA
jgi:hypothetical protein